MSTDEACTDYVDILRNFEQAQSFLDREFEKLRPKIGWQLDPFGHSSANAFLFSELGLDTMVFSRINEQEKERRIKERNLQFIWKPSFADVKSGEGKREGEGATPHEIFTHILYDHYDPPVFIRQKTFVKGSKIDAVRLKYHWLDYFQE